MNQSGPLPRSSAPGRSAKVQALLTSVSSGRTPLSHEGLDSHRDTAGRAADHLRALLAHLGLLPNQDPYLTRFEAWIEHKLRTLPAGVARPVEQFAKRHHLTIMLRLRASELNCSAHETWPWASTSP